MVTEAEKKICATIWTTIGIVNNGGTEEMRSALERIYWEDEGPFDEDVQQLKMCAELFYRKLPAYIRLLMALKGWLPQSEPSSENA